jgi:hypothetical protein
MVASLRPPHAVDRHDAHCGGLWHSCYDAEVKRKVENDFEVRVERPFDLLSSSERTEEMDNGEQIVLLLKEQNELLKKYLWRLRFSLLGLLLLTTTMAVCLGIMAYMTRPKVTRPAPIAYSVPGFAAQPDLPVITDGVEMGEVLPVNGRLIYQPRDAFSVGTAAPVAQEPPNSN